MSPVYVWWSVPLNVKTFKTDNEIYYCMTKHLLHYRNLLCQWETGGGEITLIFWFFFKFWASFLISLRVKEFFSRTISREFCHFPKVKIPKWCNFCKLSLNESLKLKRNLIEISNNFQETSKSLHMLKLCETRTHSRKSTTLLYHLYKMLWRSS